jgi:hypothetical protein
VEALDVKSNSRLCSIRLPRKLFKLFHMLLDKGTDQRLNTPVQLLIVLFNFALSRPILRQSSSSCASIFTSNFILQTAADRGIPRKTIVISELVDHSKRPVI